MISVHPAEAHQGVDPSGGSRADEVAASSTSLPEAPAGQPGSPQEDSGFFYNIAAGDPTITRPRCEAFSMSSRLARLVLLDDEQLGGSERALVVLRDELTSAVAAQKLDDVEEWQAILEAISK